MEGDMTVKTYRGKTPGEALAQVKRELGSNAVILHTKTSRTGGVLGVGARTITEITATAGTGKAGGGVVKGGARGARGAVRPSAGKASSSARGSGERARVEMDVERRDLLELSGGRLGAGRERKADSVRPREVVGAEPKPGPKPERRERRVEREPVFSGADEPAVLEPAVGGATGRLASAIVEESGLWSGTKQERGARPEAPAGGGEGLERELTLIRRMVGQVLATSMGTDRVAGMCGALEECYTRLLEAEVAAEIADEVVGRVRDELSPDELRDCVVVRQTVLRRLAAMIPVHEEPVSTARPTDGRPRTIALVGPTGVGKTTTIAKLAATYKLRLGKRVGLVTSDTYRIAAVDQLRTYANIIGLPLEVTLTPGEMSRACRALSDCDVVLIDTAGRSPNDAHRVDELRSFIDAAQPHETHLVLSSTVGESVLRRTASVFSQVGPSHVIFTKLDEAVSFGVLVNVIRGVDAKLSFVTTGQEVPDQIERGNADRLARLVLGAGGE